MRIGPDPTPSTRPHGRASRTGSVLAAAVLALALGACTSDEPTDAPVSQELQDEARDWARHSPRVDQAVYSALADGCPDQEAPCLTEKEYVELRELAAMQGIIRDE